MNNAWSKETSRTFGSFKLGALTALPDRDWNRAIKKTEEVILRLVDIQDKTVFPSEKELLTILIEKLRAFLNKCSYRNHKDLDICDRMFIGIDTFFRNPAL